MTTRGGSQPSRHLKAAGVSPAGGISSRKPYYVLAVLALNVPPSCHLSALTLAKDIGATLYTITLPAIYYRAQAFLRKPPVELTWENVGSLPHQAVIVDPLVHNVRGPSHEPSTNTFATHNNPHNATPPFFQVFSPSFLASILTPQASIRRIAYDPSFAFAHESPIWIRETDELWFSSNDGGELGRSDWDHNNVIGKINLLQVDGAIEMLCGGNGNVNVPVTFVDFPDTIQMTNGGTNFKNDLLFITSGRANLPPSIVLANPSPPYNTTVLIDNLHGRQFNSLNDIKVHPTTGAIFFTDSTYGWLNHFRPQPLLPNMVYRLDPRTGDVRAVADGFVRCNGLAFSGDGKTAYVSDTGAAGGFLGRNHTDPSTIHAYDVDPHTQAWTNRRLFAYADAGVPDGIQVDKLGNVYSACADGVHVWDSTGTLIGKFFLGASSANMAFVGEGKLAILAETAVYLVQGLGAEGLELDSF